MKTIASLFSTVGVRWGLRGDPYLWEEMRVYFEKVPLPETAVNLQTLIAQAYTTLIGHPFPTADDHTFIPIKRFDHGGMSSGLISPDFWRDNAIPKLIARFNNAKL